MRALAVCTVLVLRLAVSAAHAETVEETALRHLDRGVAAYRAGDYPRARGEFEAARRLVPSKPNPHRWLGLASFQLHDCAAAIRHFDAFLARVPPGDPRVPEIQRLRADCPVVPAPAAAAAAVETPARDAPPLRRPLRRPLLRQWWLWTAVGMAAAGVAVGIVLASGDDPARLPPIACGPEGCGSAPGGRP